MEYPGTQIGLGASGDAVKAIQGKLGIWQTSQFGPTTEATVCKFQRSHGLEVDGVVGPATWAALFGGAAKPEVGPLSQVALRIARGYVGQEEEPRGSNRGAFVDECNRLAGVPPGSFWCCAFVFRCFVEAADQLEMSNPMPRTASCSALFNWARDHGKLVHDPKPGDIFLCVGGERGHYHTGFVAGSVDQSLHFRTVEGNSNSGGDSNGYEVAERHPGRRIATCDFVRIG